MISRRKFIFFYVPVFFLLIFCYCIMMDFKRNWRFEILQPMIIFDHFEDKSQSFLVATSGCRIPSIDPFDDIVRPLMFNISIEVIQKKCGRLPPLTHLVSENNTVVVDESVLGLYGVADRKLLKCSTTAILNNVDGIKIDGYYYAKFSRPFDGNNSDIFDDHIRVQCHYAGNLIYTDFHPTIQIKPHLETKCNELYDKSHEKDTNKDYLSVFILTLDSVSRVNLHRHLQRSTDFLTETMGGIEFMGYNKLGDNTYPIVMSILTGLSVSEIENGCLRSDLKLSGCPFIWKNFSSRGYRTAYGEDAYIISSYHSYDKPGFGQQPTDYYLRPLMKAEYESVTRTPWNQDDYICFAKRVQVPVIMQYTRDFAAKMKNKPYFGYFHTNGLTHDDMNWAQLLDPMLYEFLNESHRGNYFNNTVFIYMSDHGSRSGPIRETYMGKLEESLPFLFLVFPPWFKAKHSDTIRTLKTNAKRLMSSFDIYETLSDIMNGNYDKNDRDVTANVSKSLERISLFREIPEKRTCYDANIPEHYCTCQTAELVSNTTKEALLAASAVVSKVNELTESHRNICRKFFLGYVSKIYASKPSRAFSKDKNGRLTATVFDYTVTVYVRPGVARFEGTVRFQGRYLTGVLGDISRIDRYGNSSACITDDAIIRKYCLCSHL